MPPGPKVRGLTKLQPTLSITIFSQTFNFQPSVPIDRLDHLILCYLAYFTKDTTLTDFLLLYIYIYVYMHILNNAYTVEELMNIFIHEFLR